MPRGQKQNRMEAAARREAILDTAQTLFLQQGWDAVTVADVVDAAGISKGGFYHHFAAKEDLLTGIVSRTTGQALAAAEAACEEISGNALKRLNGFLSGSLRWKAENVGEMRFLFDMLKKPGNDMLYRRIFDASACAVAPVIEGLIAAGMAEGTFDVRDPALTAELIVALAHGRRDVLGTALEHVAAGDLDAAVRLLERRMQAEAAICDRLLGVPPGSISLSAPGDYRRMLSGLAGISGDPAPDAHPDQATHTPRTTPAPSPQGQR